MRTPVARSFKSPSGRRRRGCRNAAALARSVLAIAGLCSACTLVEIHSGDGQVRSERHLGFVALELPPDTTSRVVHLTGLGIIRTGFETTVGYADVMVATLGDDCRLLVWIDTKDQIDHLHRLVPDSDNLCIMTESQ
jgi:hypothetical protein